MAAQRTASTTLAVALLSATIAIVVAQAARSTDTKLNRELSKASDLVVEACKKMSDEDGPLINKNPHFDEEPCVLALRSDNRSMVAKDHGDLAMVAFDLLHRRVNDTAKKIDSILHKFPVHSWPERALQMCAAGYASMSHTLPACRDIFLDLKPLGTKVNETDALGALLLMHRLGDPARDCAELLENWQYPESVDEFFEVVKYVGLTWGLMELATGCTSDNDSIW